MKTDARSAFCVLAVLLLAFSSPLAAANHLSFPEAPPLPAPPETTEQTADRVVQKHYSELEKSYAWLLGEYDALRGEDGPGKSLPDHLKVYKDGAGLGEEGPDGRWGSFGGLPKVFGETGWQQSRDAARSGEVGYQSPLEGSSRYPADAASLLLTPEIDLSTGYEVDQVGAAIPQESSSYIGMAVGMYGTLAGLRPETSPTLTFQARYSLANGVDGVAVMAFTQPPTELPSLGSCTGSCMILSPISTVPAVTVSACKQEVAGTCWMTGTSDWAEISYNLNSYMGHSVWIGFYFASTATTTGHGDAGAGFAGFQLDDLTVTAPALAQNLQVRPLLKPFHVAYGQALPTVAGEERIPVSAYVRNAGLSSQRVSVTAVIENGAGQALSTQALEPFELEAGHTWLLDTTFEPMALGTQAAAKVLVQATQTPQAENENADDFAAQPFVVANVRAVLPGTMQQSHTRRELGERIDFLLPLHNAGSLAETFTLDARVIDVTDPSHPEQADLLDSSETRQDFNLAPGENTTAKWTLKGDVAGKYRLFVRDLRDRAFEAADLLPIGQRGVEVPYVANPGILLDGKGLEPSWLRAATPPLEFWTSVWGEGTGQLKDDQLPVLVRLLHDGERLYVFVNATGPKIINAAGQTLPPVTVDYLKLLLDDGGDGVATVGGEDGVMWRTGAVQDLHYAGGGRFASDEAPDGVEAPMASFYNQVTPGALLGQSTSISFTGFELWRPLDSGRPDDLNGGVDAPLGLFLQLQHDKAPRHNFTVPGTTDMDGGVTLYNEGSRNFPNLQPVMTGFQAPDGDLDDELAGWTRLRLMTAQERVSLRVVGPGVGIARTPPALFEERLDDCPAAGWSQRNVVHQRFKVVGEFRTERWNCGPLEAGGRNVFFEGYAQDGLKRCSGQPCPTYSQLTGPRNPTIGTDLGNARLVTPAIEIGDVPEPWLTVVHQNANVLQLCDDVIQVAGYPLPASCPLLNNQPDNSLGYVLPLTVAQLDLQRLDPVTRSWTAPIRLIPDGGYSTEDSTGIRDWRHGPSGRLWSPATKYGQLQDAVSYRACAPDVNTIVPQDVCGWWDPTGTYPGFRGANDTVALGGHFTPPWRTDRVPLFGPQGTDHAILDVTGQTVRFIFTYMRVKDFSYNFDEPDGSVHDLGFRIAYVAVTGQQRFDDDAAVADVRSASNLFDPAIQGIAPNTALPIRVTLSNEGQRPAAGLKIRASVIDADHPLATPLCESDWRDVPGDLAPQGKREVIVTCFLGAVTGEVKLHAEVLHPTDDFAFNNQFTRKDVYPIQAWPDAAASIEVSPAIASQALVRQVWLTVENRGNVPLDGVQVTREIILRADGQGDEVLAEHSRRWTLKTPLPIGASLRIEAPEHTNPDLVPLADLRFDPPQPGSYVAVARVSALGDKVPGNDLGSAKMTAREEVYGETFDADAGAQPIVVSGEGGGDPDWSVVRGHDLQGKRLRAGDPSTGQLPPGSNSTYLLPALDLTALTDATLLVTHRYDLEEHFDAGRVEASVDGGASWLPLIPKAQPGLRDGYPSADLYGPSRFVPGLGARAAAFTGRSVDLPASDANGYLTSEFDLASHPGLRVERSFESFRLEGLAPAAPAQPHFGRELQFRHPTWTLLEPQAEERARYWWIDNLTRSEPRPHGIQMLWSGSAGESSPEDVFDPVCNAVSTVLPLQSGRTPRAGESVYLSWLDWRPGWNGDPERNGTGGQFQVDVLRLGAGTRAQRSLNHLVPDPVVVERLQDGWTRRELDVTAVRGQDVEVSFAYTSLFSGGNKIGGTQVNTGWFLDDISVDSWLLDDLVRTAHEPVLATQTLEDLAFEEDQAGPWQRTLLGTTCSGTAWSLVSGGPGRDGGWHVEPETDVPGHGRTATWRFSQDNEQGYPHLANARLVTPLVDLTQVDGGTTRLTFAHRFGFEGTVRNPNENPLDPLVGQFVDAADGAAIEFQVVDEATGAMGAWQQLFRNFRAVPETLLLKATNVGGDVVTPLSIAKDTPLPGHPANRDAFLATGYNGLSLQGEHWVAGVPTRSGSGLGFESFGGKVQHPNGLRYTYPTGYAFSGDSGGWRDESWDLSPLEGKKVRFAFHAASNPSYAQAELGQQYGWGLADIAVTGQVFQGRPALLRLHVATDGSATAGHWEADDLSIVGNLFTNNVVLTSEARQVAASPGEPLRLTGNITNIGSNPRSNLALAVLVSRNDSPYDRFSIADPTGSPVDKTLVPPSLQQARVVRIGALPAIGVSGNQLPVRIDLDLGVSDADYRVRLVLLERRGGLYLPAANQVSGAGEWTWAVHSGHRQDLRLQGSAYGEAIALSPFAPEADKTLTLVATLSNQGTTQPDVVARWTLQQVLRKGGSTDQKGIDPEGASDIGWSATTQSPLGEGPLPRGASRASAVTFVPEAEGFHRALVAFEVQGKTVATARREFFVGPGGSYYDIDFAKTPALSSAWVPDSPATSANGGGTPESIDWRDHDGRLVWGVTQAQFAAGTTYCKVGFPCNFPPKKGTPPPATGFEAIVLSPTVDLTRVPMEKAVLTIRHESRFETSDGGRLEVRLLRTPVSEAPKSAFVCPDDEQDAWFRLYPDPRAGYAAIARSLPQVPTQSVMVRARIHPLAPVVSEPAAIAGGSVAGILEFDLSQAAESPCEGVPDVVPANYTVQFRLHVGTQPESSFYQVRHGSMGWQLSTFKVSSAGLAVEPAQWSLPIRDGLPKRFALDVANTGPLPDTFHISLAAQASTILQPDWVRFDQDTVALQPGERVLVPFTVDIPADPTLTRATYRASVVVSSESDANVQRESNLDLVVADNDLPDLAVDLAFDGLPGAKDAVEAGTIAPLHATIANVGALQTAATELTFTATHDGVERLLGTVDVPSLCPVAQCLKGTQSTASFTVDWFVPAEPGSYDLVAQADARGLVLESQRLNNIKTVAAKVVPANRPDVAITSLRVLGAGPDGFVEEGALVQVVANITNLGKVPAKDVEASLLWGSVTMTDETIPLLGPGQTRTLGAVKAAIIGQAIVSALAVVPSGDETDAENNQLRRIVNVRGHELGLELDSPSLPIAAGGTATVLASIHNGANAIDRVVLALEGAPGWRLTANPNPVTVSPNGTALASLVLQAPPDAAYGTVPLRIVAHPTTYALHQVQATLEANVALREGAPRLAVGRVAAAPGQVVLPFSVNSTSNAAQEFDVFLRDPAWLASVQHVRLPPGTTQSHALVIQVPPHAAPKPHALVLGIEGGTVPLVLAKAVLEILPAGRIEGDWVRSLHAPAPVGSTRLEFDLAVVNTGNVPAVARAVPLDLGDGYAAQPVATTRPLSPGSKATLTLAVAGPADAPNPPSGRIQLWLDQEGHASQLQKVLELPNPETAANLVMSRIDVDSGGSVRQGTEVWLTARIENSGALPSLPTNVSAYVDGVLAVDVPLPSLKKGESLDVKIPVQATTAGRHLVTVMADGTQQIIEASEDDNGGSVDLTVQRQDVWDRVRSIPLPPWTLWIGLLAVACLARRRRPA